MRASEGAARVEEDGPVTTPPPAPARRRTSPSTTWTATGRSRTRCVCAPALLRRYSVPAHPSTLHATGVHPHAAAQDAKLQARSGGGRSGGGANTGTGGSRCAEASEGCGGRRHVGAAGSCSMTPALARPPPPCAPICRVMFRGGGCLHRCCFLLPTGPVTCIAVLSSQQPSQAATESAARVCVCTASIAGQPSAARASPRPVLCRYHIIAEPVFESSGATATCSHFTPLTARTTWTAKGNHTELPPIRLIDECFHTAPPYPRDLPAPLLRF